MATQRGPLVLVGPHALNSVYQKRQAEVKTGIEASMDVLGSEGAHLSYVQLLHFLTGLDAEPTYKYHIY